MITLSDNHTKYFLFILTLFVVVGVFSCLDGNDSNEKFKIVKTYPHNTDSFTQGLVFEGAYLYESTGQYGKSSIFKIDIESGNSLQSTKLPEKYFGEGITIFKDRIYQVTWKSNKGFIYDKESLKMTGSFNYPTQGWGITHNNKYLILSDGSSILYFLDPDTFEIVRQLKVTAGNDVEVSKLNELEYVKGKIYSNIWQTDKIGVINQDTGKLEDLIDLSTLKEQLKSSKKIDVLNGIAYNQENGNFYFTGKLWPTLFEVKINTK